MFLFPHIPAVLPRSHRHTLADIPRSYDRFPEQENSPQHHSSDTPDGIDFLYFSLLHLPEVQILPDPATVLIFQKDLITTYCPLFSQSYLLADSFIFTHSRSL